MYDVMVLIGMQDLLRSDFHKRFMVSCMSGIAMNLLTRVVEIRPLSPCPTNARAPYSSQPDDYRPIPESSIDPNSYQMQHRGGSNSHVSTRIEKQHKHMLPIQHRKKARRQAKE